MGKARNAGQQTPLLLIVEDDAEIRSQMTWGLKADYTIVEAVDRRSALALVRREEPSVVLLDLGLPPDPDSASEGLELLREILQVRPVTKVVVLTGNSERQHALTAIERGAYDFIDKPVHLESLKVILRRAAFVAGVVEENQMLQSQTGGRGFDDMVGTSPAMMHIYEMIRRVAGSDVSVLVTGESGTGKELVAQALHRHSGRHAGPLVAINCGAIPEGLLESELFGHEKGAFTGAHRQQKGKVESANGGTLFLDEIGELPFGLQVKLLRFLQDGRIERIGGRESLIVDARVIAATNVELRKAMEEGRFREDLFYRLASVEIPLPPLRARGDDVVLLARALLARFRSLNSRVHGLSEAAQEAIRVHPWPGNVRELENKLKRAVLMASRPSIEPVDLDLPPPDGVSAHRPTLKEVRAQTERTLIEDTLVKENGNITRTAEVLGVSRQALHDFMQRLGICRAQ